MQLYFNKNVKTTNLCVVKNQHGRRLHVKRARNVVLKRLSAIAERYILHFNFVFLSAVVKNQGDPYQTDNYLSSSRKIRRTGLIVRCS